MRAGPSVVVALMLASGAARADDHREGEYGGVTPGQSQATAADAAAKDHKRPKRPPRKDELTWIGFQSKEGGGSELFFQAPGAFTVSQWVEKGQLVILLEGLRSQVRNTRRPLDTRWFDAQLARVTARPVGARGGKAAHKAGIEVRIAFKSAKDAHEASLRTATEADGMFYAYLDFGGGGTTAAPKDEGRAVDPGPDPGVDPGPDPGVDPGPAPSPGSGRVERKGRSKGSKGNGSGSDDSDQ